MNSYTAINELYALPDDDCDISIAIRDMLSTDPDDHLELRAAEYPSAAPHFDAIIDAHANLSTHERSLLRLDASLCPLHACDYASCFDDDDPECAAIRDAFPNHDT
jgi:hypothetical protein